MFLFEKRKIVFTTNERFLFAISGKKIKFVSVQADGVNNGVALA